jgi:AcrR family transcriptional regulator
MAESATRRRRGRPRAAERGHIDSRRRLLDAAAALLAERGYSGATVDGIVAAAGLSKGTFYWHFTSKEELFLSLLEERIDRPARALMELTRTAPAESATAPDVSRGLGDLLEGQRELILLMHEYWSAAVRDEALRSRYVERQAALRAALAEALATRHERTGVPLTIPAEDLATAFIALAQGLSLEALADPGGIRKGLYGDILSLVYEGLAARAARNDAAE